MMQQIEEKWEVIRGTNGLYSISNLGRVQRDGGRILKNTLMKIGYFSVALSVNGRVKRHYNHKLVASHFLDFVSDGYVVNHKDGNKLNNCFLNLEYISRSDNGVHWAKKNHWSKKDGAEIPKGIKSSGFCSRGHQFHTTKSGKVYCKECRRLKKVIGNFVPPSNCNWKKINGYNYLISDTGLVWSNKTERVLKAGNDKQGYEYVILRQNGVSKRMSIHRLVVSTFVSEISFGFVVDHINSIKTDNRLENLRILSRQNNIKMSRDKKRGDETHGFKFTEEQIANLKWFSLNTDLKNVDLEKYFEISSPLVSAIIRGVQWVHVQPKKPKSIDDALLRIMDARSQKILDIREIKWLVGNTVMRSVEISRRYNVSEDTVYGIRSGLNYLELTPRQPDWYDG